MLFRNSGTAWVHFDYTVGKEMDLILAKTSAADRKWTGQRWQRCRSPSQTAARRQVGSHACDGSAHVELGMLDRRMHVGVHALASQPVEQARPRQQARDLHAGRQRQALVQPRERHWLTHS